METFSIGNYNHFMLMDRIIQDELININHANTLINDFTFLCIL